jgi:flavin reductase (DIM6/NTAB) family NADH-FMN oxidoreductase RutF
MRGIRGKADAPFFHQAGDFRVTEGSMISSINSHMQTKLLTPEVFRKVLSQFATGVTVVTAESAPGKVHGMTANSFTSVSLDPPLILVCVDQRAQLLSYVMEKRRFGVSILNESQQELSLYFARAEQSEEENERLGVRYHWTDGGIPLLAETMARFTCFLSASHPAGDHRILVGEVETAEMGSGQPLLFYKSQYRRIAP